MGRGNRWEPLTGGRRWSPALMHDFEGFKTSAGEAAADVEETAGERA